MALRTWQSTVSILVLGCACGSVSGGTSGDDGGITFGTAPVVEDADDAGAFAQAIAGTVNVLDSAGSATGSKGVLLTLEPGGQSTSTDQTGSFIFDSVAPGSYTLSASLPGYVTATQNVVVTLGNDQTVTFTLEQSVWLVALALDGGGLSDPFVGYAPWIAGPDGGRLPGTALFFGAGQTAWELVDGGPVVRSAQSYSQALIGFDPLGNAVIGTHPSAQSSEQVSFLDPGSVQPLTVTGQAPVLVGEAFLSEVYDSQLLTWYADGPSFLAPQQVASDIASYPAPAAVNGAVVGWEQNPCLSVLLFGVNLAVPVTVGCAGEMTPLTASVDGDRFAFVGVPDAGAWEVAITGARTTTLAAGFMEALVRDGGSAKVYPLSDSSYANFYTDQSAVEHVLIGSAGPTLDQPVLGAAPLHGEALLAVEADAGQPELTILGTSVAIPFPYPWEQPLFSDSNRYIVFPGVPSIFDLQAGIEAPLILTPVSVAFNRPEGLALVTDAEGDMAVVALGHLDALAPQGTPLEGTSVAQSFTADEKAVAHFGTDAEGNTGFFVQSLPAGL